MARPLVKLLVTDLDNTLYDWVGFFAKAFSAMVREAQVLLDVDHEVLLDELQTVHRQHHDSERPYSLLETPSVARRWPGLSPEQRRERLDPAFHAFNHVRKHHLRLYEGVEPTLAAVRDAGVPIVGHTEASAINAHYRLERLGLSPYLSRLYATDGGEAVRKPTVRVLPIPREVHKPDPQVLLEVCDDLGIAPSDALYVGDSIARDVGMAQQIGMHTAWARYGTQRDQQDWEVLLRITHWTKEDAARVTAAHERLGNIKPEVTLERFSELLDHYEFRAGSTGGSEQVKYA